MHSVTDFKGFAHATIDLFKPLTVLIGPNGVGKTNLIEALELLAFLASGQPLHAVKDVARDGAFEVRGGLQSCARHGKDAFSLGFTAQVRAQGAVQQCAYSIRVRTQPQPAIVEEVLQVGDRTYFSAVPGQNGLLEVTYDNFARGPHKPTASVQGGSAVLARYAEVATSNKKLASCREVVENVRQHLRRAYMFDPSPRLMRTYDRVGNTVLQRNGANVSAVLHGLQVGTRAQQEALQRIVELIRQVPEEPFAEIGFEVTRLNDVLCGFRTAKDGPLVDARVLSDGTLRTLAVLAAMETCEEHSRLVIEEFDNGVHPSRVAMLSRALMETARRRNLNVLVTTHNPATLNALPEEALGGVVVCHWKRPDAVAAVTPLSDLPRADELLERGRLGDLVTRRVVETYLQPTSTAAHAASVKTWLEGLP